MFESYEHELQSILEKGEDQGLFSPIVRMHYSLRIEGRRQVEKRWGTLAFGNTSPEFIQELLSYQSLFLQPIEFQDLPQAQSGFETSLIIRVPRITPKVKQQLDKISESLPTGFTCVVQTPDSESERWPSFQFICRACQHSEALIVSHHRLVWKGDLESLDMPQVYQTWTTMNAFDSLWLLNENQIDRVKLWDYEMKTQSEVEIPNFCILDFWDENSEEIFTENQAFANVKTLKVISVYSGGLVKTNGLGLYPGGLKHSTAKLLKIYELPTSFLVIDNKICFKGNRQYENFVDLVRLHLEGQPIRVNQQTKITDQALSEIKSLYMKNFAKNIGSAPVDVQFELSAYCDFSRTQKYQDHYRSMLRAATADESEEQMVMALYEQIKESTPNLTYKMNALEFVPTPRISQLPIQSNQVQNSSDSPKQIFQSQTVQQQLRSQISRLAQALQNHKDQQNAQNLKVKEAQIAHLAQENLRLHAAVKRHLNDRQRQPLFRFKFDETAKKQLQTRNDELIDQKIRLEQQVADAHKKLRESQFMITKLQRQEQDLNLIVEKRDGQLMQVIDKIKAQESEIVALKKQLHRNKEINTRLERETRQLMSVNSASNLAKRRQPNIQELKGILANKDSEIHLLKDMVRTAQTQKLRSPGKMFPSVRGSRKHFASMSTKNEFGISSSQKNFSVQMVQDLGIGVKSDISRAKLSLVKAPSSRSSNRKLNEFENPDELSQDIQARQKETENPYLAARDYQDHVQERRISNHIAETDELVQPDELDLIAQPTQMKSDVPVSVQESNMDEVHPTTIMNPRPAQQVPIVNARNASIKNRVERKKLTQPKKQGKNQAKKQAFFQLLHLCEYKGITKIDKLLDKSFSETLKQNIIEQIESDQIKISNHKLVYTTS